MTEFSNIRPFRAALLELLRAVLKTRAKLLRAAAAESLLRESCS